MLDVVDAGESLLSKLVGEQLGSVVFVADYVQFDFNGPRLSAYVWPHLTVGGRVLGMGDSTYRDGLCGLIGHLVLDSTEDSQVCLLLDFECGRLTIQSTPAELVGPEIAMLHGFADSSDWMVWRPGEAPFDGPVWQ